MPGMNANGAKSVLIEVFFSTKNKSLAMRVFPTLFCHPRELTEE
jgi:hypothetical protein